MPPRQMDILAQGAVGRLLSSEAATLRYVREQSSIPVPEVFHHSPTYENDIGIPYMLMSKAAGHSLGESDWEAYSHEIPGVDRSETRVLIDGEKKKILRQLGHYARDHGYYIGECLSPGYVLENRETVEEIPRGPFHNELDYYTSLATALRQHAEQLQMGFHFLRAPIPVPKEYTSYAKYHAAEERWNEFAALGERVESSRNQLQYCLASQFLQHSIIPRMVRPASQSVPGFPLCHHDISLQNILVDDELNITCVIDWAFASTVPPAQLLATPGMPHPRDLVLEPSLVSAFRSGFEAENGKMSRRTVDPNDWKVGEMVSRFLRVVNQDALQDYHHLDALHALALGSAPPGDAPPGEDQDDTSSLAAILVARAATHNGLALAAELAADDEPESEVRRREKEYFDTPYFDATGAKKKALAQRWPSRPR